MVGQGSSNPDASNTDRESKSDIIIDSAEGEEKFYQALKIKGNIYKVHYKDPRL